MCADRASVHHAVYILDMDWHTKNHVRPGHAMFHPRCCVWHEMHPPALVLVWHDAPSRSRCCVVCGTLPLTLLCGMTHPPAHAVVCFSQWGGYTVDPHLFPYPQDSWGAWLHETQGLHMAGNLHDATGVYASEATFDAMCAALDLNPKNTSNIPFDIMSAECVHRTATTCACLARSS